MEGGPYTLPPMDERVRNRPEGLPPWARIRREGDFSRAFTEGRRARASALVVVAVPNGFSHPRLGLSIGKRIFKGAVQRNRLKRVIKEAFRLEWDRLPKGADLIVLAAAPKARPTLVDCRRELAALSQKAWRRYAEAQGAPRD